MSTGQKLAVSGVFLLGLVSVYLLTCQSWEDILTDPSKRCRRICGEDEPIHSSDNRSVPLESIGTGLKAHIKKLDLVLPLMKTVGSTLSR